MHPRLMILCMPLLLAAAAVRADDGWFELKPTNDNGPSVIGLEDWLDRPAGIHGRVLVEGDRYVFENGEPVKFWGINLENDNPVPTHEAAEYWAERWAQYGINAVRLHKPWGSLYDDEDSTKLNAEAVERMDYLCNELRKRGIYYSWSFFYHRRLGEEDLKRVRFPEELLAIKNANIYGVVDYLPEVQQILIDATVNMLRHTNAYTGLTYAEDPALMTVEFQNEASILFWHGSNLPQMPKTQRWISGEFADFLKDKYGSAEALEAAWGKEAFNVFDYKDESLSDRKIWMVSDGRMMAPAGLAEAEEKGYRQRMVDNAEFLHTLQNDYYGRFNEAVRAEGYTGPVVGSCWRAHGGITEYLNLRSDALVGVIDRHNYHGGLRGWKPREGEAFGTHAQINEPGGGLLSSGFMQVADRPFSFSEWASVFPNEWTLEAPALIAIYGMGLQGWDSSFQFTANTKERGYSEILANIMGNKLWNIEQPANIGTYPALARMIYRGDVAEGPVVSERRISMKDLREGRLPWGDESYSGRQDIKIYEGPMPGSALAAGRCVVQFVDEPQPSTMPDMARYETNGVTTSATGQLRWDVSRPGKGFVTVHTPGTRAVIGFRPDAPQTLGGVTVEVREVPFAGVYVSSLAREESVEEAARVLVTAVARARNTGMKYNEQRDVLEAIGEAPVELEGVAGRIAFEGRTIQTVHILDHDGRRTGRTHAAEGGAFEFDGAEDEAFYYEVNF